MYLCIFRYFFPFFLCFFLSSSSLYPNINFKTNTLSHHSQPNIFIFMTLFLWCCKLAYGKASFKQTPYFVCMYVCVCVLYNISVLTLFS